MRSSPLSATPMKHSCVFAFLHDILFEKFLGDFVFVTVAISDDACIRFAFRGFLGRRAPIIGRYRRDLLVRTDVGLTSYFYHLEMSVSLCLSVIFD